MDALNYIKDTYFVTVGSEHLWINWGCTLLFVEAHVHNMITWHKESSSVCTIKTIEEWRQTVKARYSKLHSLMLLWIKAARWGQNTTCLLMYPSSHNVSLHVRHLYGYKRNQVYRYMHSVHTVWRQTLCELSMSIAVLIHRSFGCIV